MRFGYGLDLDSFAALCVGRSCALLVRFIRSFLSCWKLFVLSSYVSNGKHGKADRVGEAR